MSFAWATIALIVLLLPGFTFLAGQHVHRGFTRETAPLSPLTELAAAVLVAVALHGSALAVFRDQIHAPAVLSALQLAGSLPATELAPILAASSGRIVFYVLGTAAAGYVLGLALSAAANRPRFRRLVPHSWVLELRQPDEGVVFAHLMTKVVHEGRVLMYRGALEHFALEKDGRFAYLVISTPTRYYMHLEANLPRTSDPKLWKPIGAGTVVPGSEVGERNMTVLVANGTDIANVVFERYEWSFGNRIRDLDALLSDDALAALFDVDPGTIRWAGSGRQASSPSHAAEQ